MNRPSVRCENIPQAPTRTPGPFSRTPVRIVSAAVILVVSAALLAADEPERSAQSVASGSPGAVPGQAGPPDPGSGRQPEANGAVFVVLRLLIGAAAARTPATVEPDLMPKPWALPAEPGITPHPNPRVLRASAGDETGPAPGLDGTDGSPAGLWASNGHRASHGPVDEPGPSSASVLRLHLDHSTPGLDLEADDAELQRYEEVAPDCTEAIRLSPDAPRLYLERGNGLSRLQRHEAAVAAYERAILLDPDNPAAYLARCRAKAEPGPHEEALEEHKRPVSLDPEVGDAAAGL